VNVHVEYRRANEVYDDVLSNIVDLGLVAYPSADSKLEIVPLRKDALFLACHPQHPLAKLKSIKLKAISGQKFINFEKDIPTRKALDKLFKDHSVSVNNVMEFDNVETVKRAVEIDSGVAILPEETIRGELANKTIAGIRLEGKFFRELAVIYKKGKVLSPAMKQFIELLKTSL
jgi:DNA-binding transcriptional LysR family regulator